jgi:hypothetical protein
MSRPPGGILARVDNEPVRPGPRRSKRPLLVICRPTAVRSRTSRKNKTTKTGFVVKLHIFIPDVLSSFIVMHPLFLLGGLFCLLCRGFLRRHEYITPFLLRIRD